MQNKIIFVISLLLFAAPSYANDYVCFDQNGEITEKFLSVDGAELEKKTNCVQISRNEFNSLSEYKKVVNKKIVSMSGAEIATVDLKKQQSIIDYKRKVIKEFYSSKEILPLITVMVDEINKRKTKDKEAQITISDFIFNINAKVDHGDFD